MSIFLELSTGQLAESSDEDDEGMYICLTRYAHSLVVFF